MGPTFGGINLEDIKAPECFIIEQRLKEEMDIPVFHDDQHGTAVICAAGLMNALHLTGKKIEEVRIVLNGAGAAGIACIELLKSMGARHDNCIVCDTKGVIYQGRTEGMNQWKSAHAVKTDLRTLEEAMKGADVFLGVSVKGAVTAQMVADMADNPVIFAMANPDPEITPEEAQEVRVDAIVATGRSDYPNQVNNVLGFPYLFRGALDIHARAINDEMKIACARALAELAREDVPDEVAMAYGRKLTFGRDYIIPTPFDPRLIYRIPPAVARAGMDTGAARRPIVDMDGYVQSLKARMDPTANILQGINARARAAQSRMIFAEGDDVRVLRAAVAYQRAGLGKALVVGREADVQGKAGKRRTCRCRAGTHGRERRQHQASRDLQGVPLQAPSATGLRPSGRSSPRGPGQARVFRPDACPRTGGCAGDGRHAEVGAYPGPDQPRLRRQGGGRGRRCHRPSDAGKDRPDRGHAGA